MESQNFGKEPSEKRLFTENLISYGDKEPEIKIDLSSKLYLHVGGEVYFYK